MTPDETSPMLLRDTLKAENIEVHFQPIVSITERTVIGFEGLSRGVEMPSGRLIPPGDLLKRAVEEDLLFELDDLFRRKVFQSFQKLFRQEPRPILTVNLESRIVDESGPRSLDPNAFLRLVREHGMDPARVAIEIVESRALAPRLLERFVLAQKKHGFLIALDDVGSGHSNLDRIARLKPDLLKIDRSLILDVHREYHKQEVFRSLVGLSRQIGALVLAEGVESEEECLRSMELGADLLQGYYFSKPKRLKGGPSDLRDQRIDKVARKYHSRLINGLRNQREKQGRCEARLFDLRYALNGAQPRTFDGRLKDLLQSRPDIDALYILDEAGMQVTRTVRREPEDAKPVRALCPPPDRGSDHALKDYYYRLAQGDSRAETFVSEPYLSPLTGSPCVTMSVFFRDAYSRYYILCADLRPGCL